MPIIAICFTFWMLFCAYRGYKKGLWISLASLLSLVAAYAASLLWGASLGVLLEAYAGNVLVAKAMGYMLVYVLVYLASTLVLSALIKKLGAQQRPLAVMGALFGGGVGALSGLVLLWALSFLYAALKLNPELEAPASLDKAMAGSPQLQRVAGALVSEASGFGAQAAGVEPLQAGMLKQMVRQPVASLQNMQNLGKSRELKNFLSDRQVQIALTRGNVDELTELSAFQGLVSMPEMADLRQLALDQAQKTGGGGLRDADRYLAGEISGVWQKVQNLKDDKQFKAALADPEIQKMFKQQDYFALINNKKMQALVQRVLNETSAAKLKASKQSTIESLPNAPAKEPGSETKEVYQWQDNEGTIHFSDSPPEND
ncbi:Uncharacterized membrane protein, required for colicin V production [Alteromonadaceae bacterium Bs31]|nr:Uncharacterized membrane protein, required for colicin V production [Alteromonadaceae bacterium Bs31]